MEHMQRVRHANRGRLLLRTPGPVQHCKNRVLNSLKIFFLNGNCQDISKLNPFSNLTLSK